MHRRLLLPAVLVIAAGTVSGLSGCSVVSNINDTLHHQVQGTYDTRADLERAWSISASHPDWVPKKSTDLRMFAFTNVQSAGETPAIVRVRTTAALPASCKNITRVSMDDFSADWTPKQYSSRVDRCGDWDVMRVSDGYYGWTPISAKELAQ